MQKLTIFVVFLLLTAILCGCATATTGNTVPTDVPTTPTATQPTEPKPTEPQESGELSYTSYVAAWAKWKDFPNNRLYIIRSATQLKNVFGKFLTEEQLSKYPDSYFESSTLLAFIFRDSGENQWYRVSHLEESENGGYSIEIEWHYEEKTKSGNEKISFVLMTEVNRIIEWDTEISLSVGEFKCKDGWEIAYLGEYNQDNYITNSDFWQPVKHEEIDREGAFPYSYFIKSYDEFSAALEKDVDACKSGIHSPFLKVCEEILNEDFFEENYLICGNPNYARYEAYEKFVGVDQNGNYVIRGFGIHKMMIPKTHEDAQACIIQLVAVTHINLNPSNNNEYYILTL